MTKKVIIIDDSVTSLNLLKNRFADAYWEVHGTTSARDGYNMIFDVAPDIIVTDAIMPFVGGFQFVKMCRENEKVCKIPIIVYSVLPENNSRYYLKEESIEYFLSKDENTDELVKLAEKLVEKHPLDKDYKLEILKSKFEIPQETGEIKIPPKLEEEEPKLDKHELEAKFKEKYDFSFSDEKIFSDFFPIIYPILNYELCAVCPAQSSNKEKSIYFDVRDIIINPIFQNALMTKYGAKNIVLFKKYAPNLKMITNEDEFYSKIEFDFEYKDKTIANMVFYSKDKSKWQDEEEIETVKDVVNNFFKAYYINKSNNMNKKEDVSEKYFGDKFNILNKQESLHKNSIIYTAVISISNFSEAGSNFSSEDIDILNSKIAEKIMSCLEKDEQVIKNDEDEYSIVIYAKDEKSIPVRLDLIIGALENINYNGYTPEVIIGACNCIIDNNYNIFEASKRAYEALEETTKTEKMVIYNARK